MKLKDSLISHPLVKKTLQELYDSDERHQQQQQHQILINNFYICTTCGYRGNTLRGVKQHGKLHLSNKEQNK